MQPTRRAANLVQDVFEAVLEARMMESSGSPIEVAGGPQGPLRWLAKELLRRSTLPYVVLKKRHGCGRAGASMRICGHEPAQDCTRIGTGAPETAAACADEIRAVRTR